MADHPRSRGVYGRPVRVSCWSAGSSPLARGLRSGDATGRAMRGIIPARAGFTRPMCMRASLLTDHPRSRGVYSCTDGAITRASGSSPLARGLRQVPGHADPVRGIIPARAGFTEREYQRHGEEWDHPRSRGVYPETPWVTAPRIGSSPLARGLPLHRDRAENRRRIIPARAGFTVFDVVPVLDVEDHPRSRGVYQTLSASAADARGSSPLARGLRAAGEDDRAETRIIPARAGFTGRGVCVR